MYLWSRLKKHTFNQFLLSFIVMSFQIAIAIYIRRKETQNLASRSVIERNQSQHLPNHLFFGDCSMGILK